MNAVYVWAGIAFLLILIDRRVASRLAAVFGACSVLWLFWAFNQGNGADWINYRDVFDHMNVEGGLLARYSAGLFEWGFSSILVAVSAADLPYEFVVGFVGTLNVMALGYLLWKRCSGGAAWVALLMFLILGWYVYCEQLRQSLAVSLVLLGLHFGLEDRWRLALVLLFSAVFFHVTAFFGGLCLVVGYLVVRGGGRVLGWRWLAALAVSVCAIPLLFFSDVGAWLVTHSEIQSVVIKFNAYRNHDAYSAGLVSAGLLAYPLGLVCLLLARRHVIERQDAWMSATWSIAVLWALTGPILHTAAILTRFEWYLLACAPFALAVARPAQGANGNWAGVRLALVSFVFALSFSVRVLANPEQEIWVDDYRNILLSAIAGNFQVDTFDRGEQICAHLIVQGNPFCLDRTPAFR
jgi:hypothetical protein